MEVDHAGTAAPRGPRGQSLVEFALLLPLMLLLLFAIVDMSSMFRASLVARSAAAEASRYMQANPSATAAEAAAAAQASAAAAGEANVTVSAGAPVPDDSHAYTARVQAADGTWRTASARDQVVETTFTATAYYDTFAASFTGIPRVSVEVTSTTVQTKTGVR